MLHRNSAGAYRNQTSEGQVVQLYTAQSDARTTVDQEVAGSIPASRGNILSWRLIIKYFLGSFR